MQNECLKLINPPSAGFLLLKKNKNICKIIVDIVRECEHNECIDSELVRIKPKGEDIMLTITLNQTEFAHKDQIVAFLEDEIRDLALSIDYDVVEGDFTCVDYHQDEIFASKVHSVLVRAIDEIIGYQQ